MLSDSDDSINIPQRKRPRFKKRLTYEETDQEFKERYRFTRRLFQLLLNEVEDALEKQRQKDSDLSAKQKLLIALRFYSSGHYYYSLGDMQGVHKSTICRVVREVTHVLNESLHEYIKWPDSQRERLEMSRRFFEAGIPGIPNICGLIDGTYVNITPPSEYEAQFVNRHHNHAINAMAVCGADMEFLYLSSRWPGSTNDCRVLRNSSPHDRFENGWRPFDNAVLLGDSIYPRKRWLIPRAQWLIPGVVPRAQAHLYYESHAKIRSKVERCFALWKGRFRILKEAIRVNDPTYAAVIIKVTAYLHNFLIKRRIPEENDDEEILEEEMLEEE